MKEKRVMRGQVIIETTLGLVAAFMFFMGIVRLFFWLNDCLIERQGAYTSSSEIKGKQLHKALLEDSKSDREQIINFYKPPPLRILGEE